MGLFARALPRGKSALFFVALGTAGALVAGCGAKPVARVNSLNLTEQEFLKRCETAVQVDPRQGSVGLQVLVRWMQSALVEQEARKQNVYPSDKDVQERLDAFKRRFAFNGVNFQEQMLKQAGLTEAAFRRQLTEVVTSENVMFRGITVTDEEIRQAFERDKKTQYNIPEKLQISMITLDTKAKMEKARADLAGNAPFPVVARTYSVDRWAQNNGQVPFPITRQMDQSQSIDPKIVAAAFKLTDEQVSDPIALGSTWAIVRLDKRTAEQEARLEDFRDVVRSSILEQKAQNSPKVQENQQSLAESGRSSTIEVNRPEYAMVQEMVRQGQAAQGGPGAGPGGAPVPGGPGGPGGPPGGPGGPGGTGMPGAPPPPPGG